MPKARHQSHPSALVRVLFRPWLLLSLVLHGAVLVLPLLPGDRPAAPEADRATAAPPEVSVTLSPVPASPLPSPALTVQPSPAPIATPAQPRIAVPRPAVIPRPAPPDRPRPPAPAAPLSSPPASPAPAPAPVPVASPTPVPTPLPSPSPAAPAASPGPSAAASPSPVPVPEVSPEVAMSPSPVPYADFPHPNGVSADCGGFLSCWRVADADGRSVQAIARSLQEMLQAQGYQSQRLEAAEDTGSSLYSVTRPGAEPYYINVISTFNQGTVYLLTDEPMTAAAIRDVREGRVPPDAASSSQQPQ